jgi:hypothetical protein
MQTRSNLLECRLESTTLDCWREGLLPTGIAGGHQRALRLRYGQVVRRTQARFTVLIRRDVLQGLCVSYQANLAHRASYGKPTAKNGFPDFAMFSENKPDAL